MASANQAECFYGDDDSCDEEEASIHSAISNESDFEHDEEADYLALEIVSHLPGDKAEKLLKTLRAKEKAVQDLVQRNRGLLDSCRSLDEENQTLTERLKGADERAAAAAEEATAAAVEAAASAKTPAASVDLSVWQQMEQGKDKKILKLIHDNNMLVTQVRKLEQACAQLDESLTQTQKDLKKAQQQGRTQSKEDAARRKQPDTNVDAGVLDEEERIFRELQGEGVTEIIMKKMQKRQDEYRATLHEALQALLFEDKHRIERWGSDVTAVLMAVDGVETRLKGGAAKSGGAKKKADSKASSSSAAGGISADQIGEVSTQLLDDFDALRRHFENLEKVQLTLEQTTQGVNDGAESAAAAAELDSSIEDAEREVEWIREHNASWIAGVQALSLAPTAELLAQSSSAVQHLLSTAPPGLLPPTVEKCIQDTGGQLAELGQQLSVQATALEALQAESISFGRHVKALQAAHKAHRVEVRRRLADELRSSATALEEPLERMRTNIRQQSNTFTWARARVTRALDDLVTTLRRGVADGGNVSGGAVASSAGVAQSDEALAELRQVRSMAKDLGSSLEDGGRLAGSRMSQVLAALAGEPPTSADSTGAPTGGAGAEASKRSKKGRRKSASNAATNASGAATSPGPVTPSTAAQPSRSAQGGYVQAPTEGGRGDDAIKRTAATSTTVQQKADAKSVSKRRPMDEEADLRAEFADLDSPLDDSGDRRCKTRVLTGPELLNELMSLRTNAEALEARMAARMQARKDQPEQKLFAKSVEPVEDAEDQASEPAAQVAPKAKPKASRRKMYV